MTGDRFDRFHVAGDAAAFDQTHAEALDALRGAEAFVLAAKTPDGPVILGGTRSGVLALAVVLRAALDSMYEHAVLVAEQIPDLGVRARALADLTTWTPPR